MECSWVGRLCGSWPPVGLWRQARRRGRGRLRAAAVGPHHHMMSELTTFFVSCVAFRARSSGSILSIVISQSSRCLGRPPSGLVVGGGALVSTTSVATK